MKLGKVCKALKQTSWRNPLRTSEKSVLKK